jgi:hypothetical protein
MEQAVCHLLIFSERSKRRLLAFVFRNRRVHDPGRIVRIPMAETKLQNVPDPDFPAAGPAQGYRADVRNLAGNPEKPRITLPAPPAPGTLRTFRHD